MDARRDSLTAAVKALEGQKVYVRLDGNAGYLCQGTLQVNGNSLTVIGKPHSITFGEGAIVNLECSFKSWPEIRLQWIGELYAPPHWGE